jgi:hypothetical protein
MFKPTVLAAALLAATGWLATESRAQYVGQQSTTTLIFADLTFAESAFVTTHQVSWVPRFANDSTSLVWVGNNASAFISRTAAAVENCVIQNFQAQPGNNQSSYTVRAIDAAVTIHDYTVHSRPDGQRVSVGVRDNRRVIHVNIISSPIIGPTAPTYGIVIPGDWTSPGTGEGQMEFIGINPGWEIRRNWFFDGAFTSFLAARTSGTSASGIQFLLHGAAVPAPGSAAVVAALASMALRRRERSGHRVDGVFASVGRIDGGGPAHRLADAEGLERQDGEIVVLVE